MEQPHGGPQEGGEAPDRLGQDMRGHRVHPLSVTRRGEAQALAVFGLEGLGRPRDQVLEHGEDLAGLATGVVEVIVLPDDPRLAEERNRRLLFRMEHREEALAVVAELRLEVPA